MPATELEELERAVEAQLGNESLPTSKRIRELIAKYRVVHFVADEEADQLVKGLEARHGVSMDFGTVLTGPEWTPWLDTAKTGIEPYYWRRYRSLLIRKHFSGQVIASLDEVTDRTLGLLENPVKDGAWGRRGLVVGHVQSGKTANYTGLVCKAADAGYKVIIIIAGIHNRLRNQTQQRIDEGFVGRDSARLMASRDDVWIGAGQFDKTRRPATFTSSKRDFTKASATSVGVRLQDLSEPAIFVIKKNASTLKTLIEWLTDHSAELGSDKIDAPMLLIDDEADNASINIKHGKGEVACINGRIRQLLSLFERSCYVGYTATPFANIFIDPDTDHDMLGDDLFPRHFIVSLDPPSNYFGPTKVFWDAPTTFVRPISDNEDLLPLKHVKDHQVHGLPPSLRRAIRTFLVACAVRLARGQDHEHCSMLVNASRFTNVQRQLRNEIHAEVESLQNSVRLYSALSPEEALRDPGMASLKQAWSDEYASAGFEWQDVQSWLNEAIAPVRVVEVNSQSSGALDYAAHEGVGLKVIAVGGYSLSRGLTLEGLMTSYYLRNSVMYDTLMQMGRWFGYRPGYEDLCRVWMPEEAEGWYAHVAESMEMLRDELKEMERAGATPEEFGLKVRAHPDTLIVTARDKMGSGEKVVVCIGLDRAFIETATLWRDAESLRHNMQAAQRFASRLTQVGFPLAGSVRVSGGFLLSGVPVGPVLSLLAEFKNHPLSGLTDVGPVARYIEARSTDELAEWDVLFASVGAQQRDAHEDDTLGIKIRCQRRSAGDASKPQTLRITNKQRVASRGIERTGVSDVAARDAELAYSKSHDGSTNYPDRIYREKRKRPLLIVHLLEINPDKGGVTPIQPVFAWSMSLPETRTPQDRVEFIVNTPWLKEFYADDLDEEEMEGDLES